MGDPKKQKKKYSTPTHPWNKERIDEEKVISREYGLKNKKEIWKANSLLKKFKDQYKRLITEKGSQAELLRKQLYDKLLSLGILKTESKLDEVLDLSTNDVLNRRLQTVVFKRNLARSMKQSRQLITHQHIKIGDKKITSPGYLVRVNEEKDVTFSEDSALKSADHPERAVEVAKAPGAAEVKNE